MIVIQVSQDRDYFLEFVCKWFFRWMSLFNLFKRFWLWKKRDYGLEKSSLFYKFPVFDFFFKYNDIIYFHRCLSRKVIFIYVFWMIELRGFFWMSAFPKMIHSHELQIFLIYTKGNCFIVKMKVFFSIASREKRSRVII